MDNTEEKAEISSRVYEVGYLLLPTLTEESMPAVYGNLKDLVAGMGGEVISDEMPKMINLAYTMSKVIQNVHNKYDMAYFGWIKFVMDPEKVSELKKKLNLEENIIRFLILKTVRENTIASKRFVHKDLKRKLSPKRDDENGVSLPIDKEEIDKEIDAMVA